MFFREQNGAFPTTYKLKKLTKECELLVKRVYVLILNFLYSNLMLLKLKKVETNEKTNKSLVVQINLL